MFNFLNKKIFILGGSGLIGAKVAEKLLKSKCKVINLDIKKKFFNKDKNYSFYRFDTSRGDLKKNYYKIIKKFGLPDAFINCSYPRTKDWKKNNFKSIKFKSLKKNIEMQLVNNSYLLREVAEINRKNKKKCSIVLLSSIYGLVGQDSSIYKNTGISENFSYSIIKGSLINLTRQMSSYYTKFGIRTNCVCPGGVFDKSINKKNKNYKNLLINYSKRSPIKRMANPEEIADPIIFLTTDSASYISGATLVVDGGWTSI